jgi:hypothetical protein
VRIQIQHVDDGLRIGVEVEKPAATGDGRGQVAEVVEEKEAAHVVGSRGEADHAVTVRQSQSPAEGAVAHLFAAGNRAGAEMTEDTLVRERCTDRQPQRHTALWLRYGVDAGAESCSGLLTQAARGVATYRADGVVELADAGEPGSEGDIAERQIGGFDQHPRCLAALRSGQCERARAHLGLQHPFQLTSGVTDLRGQSGDAVPVNGAIGDQPHRPGDDVAPDVPFR